MRFRNRDAVTVLELTMAPSSPTITGWALIRERARALGGIFQISRDATGIQAKMSLPELQP